MKNYEKTSRYIQNSWLNAVKKRDRRPEFVLPYDYVPPCVSGGLTDLYYWDTYFTNLGLYADGLAKYAFQNIEDLKYCLRQFGCVPNMCRKDGADYASQPPLLVFMVKDYYEYSKDLDWLKDSVEALELEYEFWMTKRITPSGLNRYGTNFDYAKHGFDISRYAERVGLDISGWSYDQKLACAINHISEGESGEDHTPRYNLVAGDINPIDLNSYLYGFERTMLEFCALIGKDGAVWGERAEKRLRLINQYCYDKESGVYFDYNYKTDKRTEIYCVACYLPFVFGITNDVNALQRINKKLVCAHGVVSCQDVQAKGAHYQWGYPNAWAPHNYWAYTANKKLGLKEVAADIRRKWLDNVSLEFEKSGKLYEKYDGVVGGKATVNEYGLPEMLGWTAGVYQVFYNEEKKGEVE